jgi:hypothetical protein
VTDAATHAAVAGASISAVTARHDATTDSNGFFALELRDGTKPGDEVRIHIEKAGYRADDVTEAASETVIHPIRISQLGKASGSHRTTQVLPPDQNFPAIIRLKYSSRQVLQISNVPSDHHNEVLNLDSVATLHLSAPFNREVVTLLWPTLPTVTIAEPRADEKYQVPGGSGTVQVPQAGHGLAVQGLTLVGQASRITFDTTNPARFIRVGERIFRLSLESVRDNANAERTMSFEYEFAISEEDPTEENRAAAISQEAKKPPQSGGSYVEKILASMNSQPVGTLELQLREIVDGQPNVVQLSTGTKLFLFDPIARVVVFRMVTISGRSVNLRMPLEKPAAGGRHFVAVVWDTSKGARLHVNDKFIGDGL